MEQDLALVERAIFDFLNYGVGVSDCLGRLVGFQDIPALFHRDSGLLMQRSLVGGRVHELCEVCTQSRLGAYCKGVSGRDDAVSENLEEFTDAESSFVDLI